MNFLTHTLTFLLGAFALIFAVILISYYNPTFVEEYDHHGKVVATATEHTFYDCDVKGFTLIQLQQSKKYVITCGVNEKPGQNVTVTLDKPEGVQL